MSKGEGLYPAPTKKRIQELDARLSEIQKGTRAAIPAMVPLHDIIRQKFRWYYNWTKWPASKYVNLAILLIYIMGAAFYAYNAIYFTKKASASTVTYTYLSPRDISALGSTATSAKATFGSYATGATAPDAPAADTEMNSTQYSYIESSNETPKFSNGCGAPSGSYIPYQMFRFYIDPSINKSLISEFRFTHEGFSTFSSLHNRNVFIFNFTNSDWGSSLGSSTSATDQNLVGTQAINLTYPIANYMDSNRYVYFMVRGNAAVCTGNTLTTDYVNLQTTYTAPPAAPAITSPNGTESWPINSSANPVTWTSSATNQVEAANLTQYDNFNDDSVDTNIWTTNSFSSNGISLAETGNEVLVNGTAVGSTGSVSIRTSSMASASRVYMAKIKPVSLPNNTSWTGVHLMNGGNSKNIYLVYSGDATGWRTGGTGLTQVAAGNFGNETTEYKTVKIISNTLINKHHIYVIDADGTEHFVTTFTSDLTSGGADNNVRFQFGTSILAGSAVESHMDDAMIVPFNPLVSETFDSYDNGSNISGQGGWTTANVPANGTTNIDNTATRYLTSPNSLKHTKTSTNTFNAGKAFTAQTGTVVVEWDGQADQTNAYLQYVVNGPSGGTGAVNFADTGYITTSTGNLQTYAADTWYHFRMVLDVQKQKSDIYIDGVLRARDVSFFAANTSLTTFYVTGAFGGTGNFWTDNVQVYTEFKNIAGLSASGTSQAWNTTGWTAGTKYLARARTKGGADNAFGPWDYSNATFTLYDVPTTPSITAPTDAATDIAVNPTITSSAFSGGGSHTVSDWEIYDNAAMTASDRVWYKADDATNLTSIVVNTTNGTFENALSGQTALANGTQYWVRVRHANAAGDSSFSVGTHDFTTVVGSPPADPTNVTVDTITTTSATSHWTDNANDETGYKVWVSTTSNATCSSATYNVSPDYTPAADAISQALSSLTPAKSYCVKVVATKSGVDSGAAYSSQFWALPNAPGAPTINGAAATALTIIIDQNSNDSTTKYAISCDGDTNFINYTTNACEAIVDDADHWRTYANWGGASGFADTGLGVNTSHIYKVKARNEAGTPDESALSSGTTEWTLANTPLAPTVANIAGTDTDRLNVIINANSNPASTEFAFGIDNDDNGSVDASGWVQADGTLGIAAIWQDRATWGGDTGTNVTGLSANTNYKFKVQARNGDTPQVETSLSPLGQKYTRIQVPTGITFGTVNSSSIQISASGTLSNLASGSSGLYFTETSGNPGAGGAGFGTWTQTNDLTDSGLNASTTYTYKVKARNGDGTETAETITFDQATSAPPVLLAPDGVSLTTDSISQLTVNWNDNSGNEEGFKVYISTAPNADCSLATYPADELPNYTTALNAESQAATGLSANSQYCAKVVAYEGVTNSSAAYAATPKYTKIEAPTNIDFDGVTATSLQISSDVTLSNLNQGSSKVVFTYVASPTGGTGGTSSGDLTSDTYTDTVLQVNQQYCYRVQAFNGDGVASTAAVPAAGNGACKYTLANIPTAPTVANVGTSTSQLKVTVNKNGNPEGDGSIGPQNAATIVNDASNNQGSPPFTVPWGNLSNASSSNNSYASSNFGSAHATDYLKATNFDFSSVPDGATIDGIKVEVEKKATSPCNNYDSEVKLVVGGAITGDNKAKPMDPEWIWPTTDDNTYTTYGSLSDKWGLTPTAAQVKASNFGVVFSGSICPGGATLDVDHIRMTVYYSGVGGTQYAIYDSTTSKYVKADGTELDATPVWQAYSAWGGASGINVTGLATNSNHAFQIKARNGDNTETALSSSDAQYTYIEAPTTLTFGTVADNNIPMSATGSFTNLSAGTSGLSFKQTTANAGGGGQTGFDPLWTQTNSVNDTGLTAGTQYCYQVKSRNGDGTESTGWLPASPSCQTTTNALAQPTAVTIGTITTTGFTVTWNNTAVGETAYKVYVSTAAAADCSTATYPGAADYTTAANATSQAVSGKSINTQYCAKVTSYNGSSEGNPGYSAPKYTLANAPGTSTLTAVSTSSINIQLNKNGNPESGVATTEILRPNADGVVECNRSAGATNYSLVNEVNADDSTTYVSWEAAVIPNPSPPPPTITDNTCVDLYDITSPSAIQPTDTINSVTIYFRHKRTEGNINNNTSITGSAKLGGTTLEDSDGFNSGTTYATDSSAIGRPGGGSWAYNDLANLQVGVKLTTGPQTPSDIAEVTQVYAEVNYTPASTSTNYAIGIDQDDNGSVDANGWVQSATGALGAAADWATYATWGGASGKNVTGLSINTQYEFIVKARNGDNTETAFNSGDLKYTLANTPAITVSNVGTSTSQLNVLVNKNSNPEYDANQVTVGPVNVVSSTTIVNVDGGLDGNYDWANPENAAASDNLDAAWGLIDWLAQGDYYSDHLKATGFNLSSIPDGTLIRGVEVKIEKARTDNPITTAFDDVVSLVVNDTIQGSNKAAGAWGTTDAYTTYGGVADTWGLSLTATQVKAANFGVSLKSRIHRGANGMVSGASVDHIQMSVTYSLPVTEYAIQRVQTTPAGSTCYLDKTDGTCDAVAGANNWGGYSEWGSASGYTNTGLLANTQYTYSVKARNGDDVETALSATDAQYTYIQTPTGQTFDQVGDNSIRITATGTISNLSSGNSGLYFTASSSDGGTGFGSEADFATNWTKNNPVTDTGLTAGKTFCYTVTARNGDGTATGLTTAQTCQQTTNTTAQPTGISIDSITTTGFTVNWTDNAVGEQSYKVYISSASNANCSLATYPGTADFTTAANATNQAVIGKSVNAQYCAKVASYNGSSEGTAGYSAPKYTLANAPTAPTVTNTPSDNPTTKLNVVVNKNGNPEGNSSVGPQNPSTIIDDASGGGSLVWTNPGNASTHDSSYASMVAIPNPTLTHNLKATNFDFSSIPDNATISGVTVGIERKVLGMAVVQDSVVRLVIGGSVTGNNKADTVTNWPLTDTYANYGGSADLWGTTPTVAQVKASNFGVVLQALTDRGPDAGSVQVNHMRITVNYTVPGGDTQYAYGIDNNNDGNVDANGWVQAGNTLGASEAWQTYSGWGGGTGEKNTGLSINNQYCYRVKARNGDNVETILSSTGCKYTHANVPSAPTVAAQSWDQTNGNALSVVTNANSNPVNTEFAISCNTGETLWLQNDGTCEAPQIWKTKAIWETGVVNFIKNLPADTNYTIKSVARNGDNLETLASTGTTTMTAPAQPTGLTHTGHNNSLNQIVWDMSNNGVAPTGYQLLNGSDEVIESSATSDFTQNQSDAGGTPLAVNTQYTVKARAYRGAITGQPTATTQAYTPIEAVTGFTWGTLATDSITSSPQNTPSNLSAGNSGIRYCNTTTSDCSVWQQNIDSWQTASLTANSPYNLTITSRNGDGEAATPALVNKYTAIETPISNTGLKTPNSVHLRITNDLTNLGTLQSAYQFSYQIEGVDDPSINNNPNMNTRVNPGGACLDATTSNPWRIGGQIGFWNHETCVGGNPQIGQTWNNFEGPDGILLVDTNLLSTYTGITYKVRARNAQGIPTPWVNVASFNPPSGEELKFILPGQTLTKTPDAFGNLIPTITNDAPTVEHPEGGPWNQVAGSEFDVKVIAAAPAIPGTQPDPYIDQSYTNQVTLTCPTCPANKYELPPPTTMSAGELNFNTPTQRVKIDASGTYSLTGTGSGGTSDEFEVIPGTTSASVSTASASPDSLEVGSTSTISVNLKDAYGNAISGHYVTVASDQVGDIFTNNGAITDSNGNVIIYLSSGFAHTSSLTVTDTTDVVTLNARPQVIFSLAPENPPSDPEDPPSDDAAIENPTNFTGSAADKFNTLSWLNPGGIDHIHIYRSTTEGELGTLIADNVNDNNYTDSNLTNDTTYYYTLKSSDASGNLSSGTYQLALTPAGERDNQAPTAPSNLRATDIGSENISLMWDASRDNVAVVGYRIFNAQTGIQIAATVETNIALTGLSPETLYGFYVRSYDAAGNLSENSNTLTVTTLALAQGEGEQNNPYICRNGGGKVAFLVLGNIPQEIKSGDAFPDSVKVKLIAADGGGSLCEDYRGLIYFDSSDKKAEIAWTKRNAYKFSKNDGGIHEFKGSDFKLFTPGEQTITATDSFVSGMAEVKVLGGTVVFQKAQKEVNDFVDDNAFKVNTAVITASAALLFVPAFINVTFGLANVMPQILYWLSQLLQLLGIRKRRKPWGVVFNSQTGQPISMAVVRIYDRQYNRMLESTITDRQGRFGFLVRPGTFYLIVKKASFDFPPERKVSDYFDNIYAGGNIEIGNDKEKAVLLNVPLDPKTKVPRSFTLWVLLIKVNRLLQKVRIPLMVAGVIFAIIMTITQYNLVFALSIALYAALFIFELLRMKKAKPYGIVTDVFGHPLELSIVRIYNKKTNLLAGTDVTDSEGRFRFLVNPGVYYMTAAKPGHVDFKSHIMYLEKEGTLVTANIKLKKIENK